MKVEFVRKWRDEVRESHVLDAAWNPEDAMEAVEDRTLTLSVTDYDGRMVPLPDGKVGFQPKKRRQDVEITFTLDELRALKDALDGMDLS